MTSQDLKMYKFREEYIKDRIEYIEEYKQTVYKLNTTISDMPISKGKVQDSMAEKIVSLMDYADEVLVDIKDQQNKQKEIIKQVDNVEFPYKNILIKVYIHGKGLSEVSDELGYEYKYLCKQHKIALTKFDDNDKKDFSQAHKMII